jgi:general stress protein YciG
MTKKKENPMSRVECAKKARASVRKLWTPFRDAPLEQRQSIAARGGRKSADRLREMASAAGKKGGATPRKPKYLKGWGTRILQWDTKNKDEKQEK